MKHLLIFAIFFTSLLTAQVRELAGKIIDDEGNTIYLANVAIEKTGVGTTSDKAGEFVLKAEFDEGDNLIISYIGYKSIRKPIKELFFDRSNTFFLSKLSFTSQTVLVKGSLGREGVSPISFSKVDQKEIDESLKISLIIFDKEQRPVAVMRDFNYDYASIVNNSMLSFKMVHNKIQLSKGVYSLNISVNNGSGPFYRANSIYEFQVSHKHEVWQPF